MPEDNAPKDDGLQDVETRPVALRFGRDDGTKRSGAQLRKGRGLKNVQLRNGARLKAREVAVEMATLECLSLHHPLFFAALVEAVGDPPRPLSEESLEVARSKYLTDAEGHLLETVKNVLVSALRRTPEGLVLGSPVKSASDSEAIAEVRHHANSILRNPPKPGDPGLSV